MEGQRARSVSGLPAGDRPQRWGALLNGVVTQRFARMRYVVTGLVPARIEVRPSNGLGSSLHPDLESQNAQLGSTQHARTCNRIMKNDATTPYQEQTDY